MLNKLYNLIREWDERRLVGKVESSHQKVLDSFSKSGINIGATQIKIGRAHV